MHHTHTWSLVNYPISGLIFNFYHNPDGEPQAWCYINDINIWWEFCDVWSSLYWKSWVLNGKTFEKACGQCHFTVQIGSSGRFLQPHTFKWEINLVVSFLLVTDSNAASYTNGSNLGCTSPSLCIVEFQQSAWTMFVEIENKPVFDYPQKTIINGSHLYWKGSKQTW